MSEQDQLEQEERDLRGAIAVLGTHRDTLGDAVVDPAVAGLRRHLEALSKLEQQHPRKAELVKLRFFAGLTGQQAAKVLGISQNTADRYWAYARSWLHLEITKPDRTNQD